MVAQLVKKFCVLQNLLIHYRVHKILPLYFILDQMHPAHTFTSYFLKVNHSIIVPSTAISPKWPVRFVYHRCSSCWWVKKQPRIKLSYKYLLSLYTKYEGTSAWRFAGCWLKVSLLLGSLCVCLHLWVLCVECCCCYICCGLSRSFSDRVVDTLSSCLFPLFAELFPWERVLLTLKRGWLHCCGNVFIRPLLSIGCLLNCDGPAPELMQVAPTDLCHSVFPIKIT
jgi:hypothetical protein